MTPRITFNALLIFGLAFWPSAIEAQRSSADERPTADGETPRSLDLLPFLEVSRMLPEVSQPASEPPFGGYVRFWIVRDQNVSELQRRLYGDERRDWVQRFFIGRTRSRLLTARLVVNRQHVVTQSVTLAAASHDSNRRQGENWSSELGDARFLTPYFRVDQGITASIDVTLSASATVDADVTRNVLSIVERGARLVAPSAPLVTSLTSTQLTESADFVDSSISRLFGQAVAERSQSDLQAGEWRADKPVVTISAIFPMGSRVWQQPRFADVGSWSIYVSAPIVSIFSNVPLHGDPDTTLRGPAARCRGNHPHSDEQSNRNSRRQGSEDDAGDHGDQPLQGTDLQACIAFSGISPAGVLGLPVGENQTLGQALRGDAAISAAVQRYQSIGNGNPGSGNQSTGNRSNSSRDTHRSTAREVCNLVAERADGLGLNAYDAAATVWAFAWNGSLAETLANDIWSSECATANLAKHLRLNDPPASVASPEVPQQREQPTPPKAPEQPGSGQPGIGDPETPEEPDAGEPGSTGP